jgi:hypothetical protein
VAGRGERSTNRFYIIITFLVVILIILTVFFSGNQLIQAYVVDDFLDEGWIDSGEREYNERLLGLEKQASFKYIIDSEDDDRYPAFLTVTTLKTLFMLDENELLEKTIETINQASVDNNIEIENDSRYSTQRYLKNGHSTIFVVFNGSDNSSDTTEDIVIIGETWNCGPSGTSIICIGVAQITDNVNNNSNPNYTHLIKIIGDEDGTFVDRYNSSSFITTDGLIFNVKCH